MTDFPRVGFVAGTLGLGGAERQLYEQCRILVDAGRTPVVVTLTEGEHWEGPLRELGVVVHPMGRRDGGTRRRSIPAPLDRPAERAARVARVVRVLRRTGVDVVQATHAMTNLYAVAAGRALGRPAVGALRTTPDRVLAEHGRLGALTLRAPDLLAVNSRANLRAAVAIGVARGRARYLPNVLADVAVDADDALDPAPPGNAVRASGEGPVDVVFVGRLGPEKRVDVLIDALGRLRDRGRTTTAAIVGDGPLRTDLVAQASRLGLDETALRFVGADPDAASWLARAGVLVLPSDREGTPNVVLEAMAAGVPVVATPVGDVRELLAGGCGTTVPVGEVGALVDALVGVLDPDRAPARAEQAARARRRVIERHGRDAVAAAMHDLYRGAGRVRGFR